MLLMVPLTVTGCFRLGGEGSALRDSVVKATEAECSSRIEFGVGRFTLGLARVPLAFVDLPEEARSVVSAVKGAQVGVYEIRRTGRNPGHGAVLSAADKAMARKGWERVVGVLDGKELVAVYTPKEAPSQRNLELCLMVFQEREMVVVQVRGNPEPLLDLALRKAKEAGGDHVRLEL